MALTPIDINALPLAASALMTDLLVIETAEGTRSVQLQVLSDDFAREWSGLTNVPTTPPPTTPPPTTVSGGFILSVNGGQPGIAGTSGSGSYTPGTIVPIQAFLLPGWIFNAWSDDISYLTGGQFANPNSVVQPGVNMVLTATATYTGTPPPTTPPPTTPSGGTMHVVQLGSSTGTYFPLSHQNNTDFSMTIDLGSYHPTRIEFIQIISIANAGGNGDVFTNGTMSGVSIGSAGISDHGTNPSATFTLTIGPINKVGSDWIADIATTSGWTNNNGTNGLNQSTINLGPGPFTLRGIAFAVSGSGLGASSSTQFQLGYIS